MQKDSLTCAEQVYIGFYCRPEASSVTFVPSKLIDEPFLVTDFVPSFLNKLIILYCFLLLVKNHGRFASNS